MPFGTPRAKWYRLQVCPVVAAPFTFDLAADQVAIVTYAAGGTPVFTALAGAAAPTFVTTTLGGEAIGAVTGSGTYSCDPADAAPVAVVVCALGTVIP